MSGKYVVVLALLACAFVAVNVAQATDALLVDRGLPTFGVYAPSWNDRTNIGTGDYDYKDPIYVQNNWGDPSVPGDDFTLPTNDIGFHVTDIRMWIRGSSTLAFSDEFNNIGLMVGPKGGPLTNLGLTPAVTSVGYPNGQSPSVVLWQLDYAVNFTGAPGQQYSFAILPDGKPCNNASGNGESYYIAFTDCVMTAAQTGYNPGGDGYVSDYYLNGTFADSFTFPEVYGGVRAGDIDVQVLGNPVPEPITMALVGMGIAGLGGYVRRRMATK